MKRKGFLRSLATFIAAPSLIESVGLETPDLFTDYKMPLGTKDCYTPIEFSNNKGYYNTIEIMRIYEQTGNLIYQPKL